MTPDDARLLAVYGLPVICKPADVLRVIPKSSRWLRHVQQCRIADKFGLQRIKAPGRPLFDGVALARWLEANRASEVA